MDILDSLAYQLQIPELKKLTINLLESDCCNDDLVVALQQLLGDIDFDIVWFLVENRISILRENQQTHVNDKAVKAAFYEECSNAFGWCEQKVNHFLEFFNHDLQKVIDHGYQQSQCSTANPKHYQLEVSLNPTLINNPTPQLQCQNQRNLSSPIPDNIYEIDLHGMTRESAMERVKLEINDIVNNRTTNRYLKIITGRGSHGGGALIKNGVQNLLNRENISFKLECNGGAFVCLIPKQQSLL